MPDERCSIPNPHALAAALSAAAPYASRIAPLSADAPGASAVWPLAVQQLPLLGAVLRSPIVGAYDINGGPMVPDAFAHELVRRMLRDATEGGGPAVIHARAIAGEGPAWDVLTELAAAGSVSLAILDSWERAMLDRAAAPDAGRYFDTFLSASQRKQLRRKQRALEDGGTPTLRIAASPDDIPAAFDVFCALEANGWKGRTGTALTQDRAGAAYVRAMLMALAAEGAAFVAQLMQGERPIAAGLFLRVGGEVVFWKTAYDEALAKHSPGVVFDVMLTEWLYAQPWFERLDAGHDDSVDPDTLIWKQRRRMANVAIDLRPGSLKGRVVTAALRLRQRLRAWKNRRRA
ncbi:MAG: GNAT family N-acetyltransferase [Beijerinckiaceae bacterium]